jgi:hypothetical protein
MDEQVRLAERFEANRRDLRAVAYGMLGSLSEVLPLILSASDTSACATNAGGIDQMRILRSPNRLRG